jgi:hypothetical protein
MSSRPIPTYPRASGPQIPGLPVRGPRRGRHCRNGGKNTAEGGAAKCSYKLRCQMALGKGLPLASCMGSMVGLMHRHSSEVPPACMGGRPKTFSTGHTHVTLLASREGVG